MKYKSLLRLFALSLVVVLALPTLASCDLVKIVGNSQEPETSDTSDTSTPDAPEQPEAPVAYDPERVTEYALNSNSPVLVTGRTIALDAGLALDLSASSMRFYTTGGGDVSLKGTVEGVGDVYFTIYIDGERQATRVLFANGESTQTIAKDLSNEKHLIEVVRQTEGQFGTFTAQTLTMKGSLFGNKPAETKLYI